MWEREIKFLFDLFQSLVRFQGRCHQRLLDFEIFSYPAHIVTLKNKSTCNTEKFNFCGRYVPSMAAAVLSDSSLVTVLTYAQKYILEIPISSTKCISRFMWRDIYCICISRTSISWRSLGRFIFKITSFSLLSGSFSLVSRCEYSVHIVMCRYWQVFKYIWYYLFTCLVLSSISSKWVSSWEYLVCQCIDRPLADTTYLVEK